MQLTVQIKEKVRAFSAEFYVTINFSLPVDGILGLETLKELQMAINPDLNAVTYRGQHIRGMDEPMPLAPSVSPGNQCFSDKVTVSPVSVTQQAGQSESRHWRTVSATVEGSQVIPDGVAKCIKIKAKGAPVGSDISVHHASNINRLAVEATFSRVKEGHMSEALAVNASGASISLKHGVLLSPCLAYGTRVVSEPADFPSTCVSSAVSSNKDLSNSQAPMEPLVKVAHYTEMKPAG